MNFFFARDYGPIAGVVRKIDSYKSDFRDALRNDKMADARVALAHLTELGLLLSLMAKSTEDEIWRDTLPEKADTS